jgi:hypothetical protein
MEKKLHAHNKYFLHTLKGVIPGFSTEEGGIKTRNTDNGAYCIREAALRQIILNLKHALSIQLY